MNAPLAHPLESVDMAKGASPDLAVTDRKSPFDRARAERRAEADDDDVGHRSVTIRTR